MYIYGGAVGSLIAGLTERATDRRRERETPPPNERTNEPTNTDRAAELSVVSLPSYCRVRPGMARPRNSPRPLWQGPSIASHRLVRGPTSSLRSAFLLRRRGDRKTFTTKRQHINIHICTPSIVEPLLFTSDLSLSLPLSSLHLDKRRTDRRLHHPKTSAVISLLRRAFLQLQYREDLPTTDLAVLRGAKPDARPTRASRASRNRRDIILLAFGRGRRSKTARKQRQAAR